MKNYIDRHHSFITVCTFSSKTRRYRNCKSTGWTVDGSIPSIQCCIDIDNAG